MVAGGTILVVDDEVGIRTFIADALSDAGHLVVQAGDADDALAQLEDRPFDLMFLDMRMPGPLTGMDVLRRARALWPDLQVVVLTAHGTVGMAVEAMRIGAFDFMEKPLESPAVLRRLAARALNWRGTLIVRPGQVEAVAPQQPARRRGVLGQLLWQLKHRHVYKVAVTYAAVGFLTLQGAELILPALPLPNFVYPALTVVVLTGFPVAIILGWLYDITESGVSRTRTVTGGE